MILSMTGYGDAQHTEGGVGYALEVRSLNNRYFKAVIKLPEYLQGLEAEVEKMLRARLGRGSITFTLRVRNPSADAAYDINIAALQAYLDQMNTVRQNPAFTVDLGAMLMLPGVCQPKESSEDLYDRELKIIERLASTAIDKLLEMRVSEGRALREDLLKHTSAIQEHLTEVKTLAPTVVEDYHRRLRQRVASLTGPAQLDLDKEALTREVALFADRCDISEEISRLTSHLNQFIALCDSQEPAGRKLEFLAQEMLREANTVGSKANNADIAHHVVEIKSSIDRLKEQVLNAE